MARPRGGLGPELFFFKPAIPGEGLKPKISFEAHIIGITDASSPAWNENYDMGRADPVMTYGGMSRNISIAFVVVAVEPTELTQNYYKLRQLANLTYPIYKRGKGFNAPHIFYNIGYHLSGYGILTSIDFAWQGENPWIGKPLRPVLTEVTLSIKVLGDPSGKRPEYQNGAYDYFGD